MAEKGTVFSHIKTLRVTKRWRSRHAARHRFIHSDDSEAILCDIPGDIDQKLAMAEPEQR